MVLSVRPDSFARCEVAAAKAGRAHGYLLMFWPGEASRPIADSWAICGASRPPGLSPPDSDSRPADGRTGSLGIELPFALYPILMPARLLKPLGNPPSNGNKFFATAELLELVKDKAWLVKVTNAVNQHWHRLNARKKNCPANNSLGSQQQNKMKEYIKESSQAAPTT